MQWPERDSGLWGGMTDVDADGGSSVKGLGLGLGLFVRENQCGKDGFQEN